MQEHIWHVEYVPVFLVFFENIPYKKLDTTGTDCYLQSFEHNFSRVKTVTVIHDFASPYPVLSFLQALSLIGRGIMSITYPIY